MKQIWNSIQTAFIALGGTLGWFLGGADGFLYALIAFVVTNVRISVCCVSLFGMCMSVSFCPKSSSFKRLYRVSHRLQSCFFAFLFAV